jgi:BirA family biotin operon repressor/biotin-[acetyl-CoA-carboxylase] ligase
MKLGELLRALDRPGGVSGTELAARFGVTRAAVSKRLAQLRAEGLPLVAVRGSGYRLDAPLELLEASAIRAALPAPARALLTVLRIEDDIDSTSSALLRAAADGAPSGTACFAERQSAGRGRRGRRWVAAPAGSVCLSLLWRFEHGLASLGGLSIALGVAAVQALRACGAREVQLKWPNDLVAGERKLGGILVDAAGDWAGPCHVVAGIGVNLRMPTAAAHAVDQPWTDLARCAEPVPPRRQVAAGLLAAWLLALQRFAAEGAQPFLAGFAEVDALAGRPVRIAEGERHWDGHAHGIDPDGRLRVLAASGELRRVSAAEVSVRRAGVA